MANFVDRIRGEVLEVKAMRGQPADVPMLPIGVPKWLAVVVGFVVIALMMQAWTKHVGRAAGATGGGVVTRTASPMASATPSAGVTTSSASVARVSFAPGDDLTGTDIKLLGGATKTVDVAAAGNLDDAICRAIGIAARRGVAIRLLRDPTGFAAEQERAGGSCANALKEIGADVRVAEAPMVLESYVVDGRWLRSGTAPLSRIDGRTGQEISLTESVAAVNDFERTFGVLWSAPDTRIVHASAPRAEEK